MCQKKNISKNNLRKQATIKRHFEVSQLGTKDHLNYSFKMTFHLRSESIPCGASSKQAIYVYTWFKWEKTLSMCEWVEKSGEAKNWLNKT